MVKLSDVVASNARISAELPPGLVGVFAGATSGIGEYTVLSFAKHARDPKVYIIGRSQAAADRIIAECKRLNPGGQYIFIQTDASLLKNVDDVCRQLKEKEKTINILFLSIGTLNFKAETSEGLRQIGALQFYSRIRFIANLLPQIQAATGLRRVVSCFAGTKEGDIPANDIAGRNMSSPIKGRGHGASIMTLSLEQLAQTAPDVSFVHDFPGGVRTGIGRTLPGPLRLLDGVFGLLAPLFCVPNDESGERHVFLATSAMYPTRHGGNGEKADGIAIAGGSGPAVARGTDGEVGSGVYTVGQTCDNGSLAVDQTLARLRKDGMREKVWTHVEGEFERITGTPKMA